MINKFDIELLNNIPIIDVADRLGLQLRNNKCLCFLHNEKTPSFSINPKKNIWKCFGCGEGGGVIKLVEKYNKCKFIEACTWLSNTFIYNIKPKQQNYKRKIEQAKTETGYKADPEIYKWFFDNLSVTENVKEFIKSRKYPEWIIEKYNLKGLDYDGPFFEKCRNKWGIEMLLKCGIAKKDKTDKITYMWKANTIFFPFYENGNISYIQGKPLSKNAPKYICLNEIETIPFNLQILERLQKGDTLVIAEGITDCISCCLMGKNAIGILGAHAFKKEYVEQLKDFDINVIPDNDSAGEGLANKIRNDFLVIGKTINIYYLKGYKDISEYYMGEWEKNHGNTD
jgi:DNA primase catalytic core